MSHALDMGRRNYSWALTSFALYRSSDDGVTWDSVYGRPPKTWIFDDMNVLDGNTIQVYSTAQCEWCSGLLHMSTDAGRTWAVSVMQGISPGGMPDFGPVVFSATNALGVQGQFEYGQVTGGTPIRVISSRDNWFTFKEEFACSAPPLDPKIRISFLDDRHGWLIIGNRLLTTGTGGVNDVEQPSLPKAPSLSQNYPNPFRGSTTIPLRIGGERQVAVRVELFDAMGRNVMTVFEGIVPAGEYIIPVDASRLPPGMYVARLISNGRMETKKMMVTR